MHRLAQRLQWLAEPLRSDALRGMALPGAIVLFDHGAAWRQWPGAHQADKIPIEVW